MSLNIKHFDCRNVCKLEWILPGIMNWLHGALELML